MRVVKDPLAQANLQIIRLFCEIKRNKASLLGYNINKHLSFKEEVQV